MASYYKIFICLWFTETKNFSLLIDSVIGLVLLFDSHLKTTLECTNTLIRLDKGLANKVGATIQVESSVHFESVNFVKKRPSPTNVPK